MTLSEAFILIQQGSPWSVMVAAFALVPFVYRGVKDAVPFHNEFIRHYRLRNIERAAESFPAGSMDKQLFDELRAQESTFLNTGLWLSKVERAKVLGWLEKSPSSIKLIREAWPHVNYESGALYPTLTRSDRVFMWYGLAVLVFTSMMALALSVAAIAGIGADNSLRMLIMPLFMWFLFGAMLRQVRPQFAARKLKFRLDSAGFGADSAQADVPRSPGGSPSD